MRINTRVEKLIKYLTYNKLVTKREDIGEGDDKGELNIKITTRPVINPK
jgi:hypothetical protein